MSFQSVGVTSHSLFSSRHSWLYLAPASLHTSPLPTNTHTVPENAAPFRIQAKVSWSLNRMDGSAEPQLCGAAFCALPSVQGPPWSLKPGAAGPTPPCPQGHSPQESGEATEPASLGEHPFGHLLQGKCCAYEFHATCARLFPGLLSNAAGFFSYLKHQPNTVLGAENSGGWTDTHTHTGCAVAGIRIRKAAGWCLFVWLRIRGREGSLSLVQVLLPAVSWAVAAAPHPS